jgi:hypothetical protein
VSIRRRVAAIAATVAIAGGGIAAYAINAHASVQVGNFIEVGCSTPFDVLVYTVVDRDGNPTGEMDSLGWACTHDGPGGLDLQNYVRVSEDQFGNVIVREYPSRLARGVPLTINVVPGWERGHEH